MSSFKLASARDFQQSGTCDQQSLRSACANAQSDRSLCLSLEYSITVKLLTEHYSEFLSFKGGCTGSSESTLVKMLHRWKSHVTDQMVFRWWGDVGPLIYTFWRYRCFLYWNVSKKPLWCIFIGIFYLMRVQWHTGKCIRRFAGIYAYCCTS